MGVAVVEPVPVPLVKDQAGRLMVPGSRISLDVLIAAFKRGKTPEAIHRDFRAVSVADVYAVFAYYLLHRDEVEEYLAEQDRDADAEQARIEALYPPEEGLRAKLLSRLGQ